jgi:hypothetical protein
MYQWGQYYNSQERHSLDLIGEYVWEQFVAIASSHCIVPTGDSRQLQTKACKQLRDVQVHLFRLTNLYYT